ncbi:protein DMP10 [Euphorbia lathyris]|uniref:protein DMP10 n=1 Tax=Euphorbia lathyris TaxID=212925 RepID=UPI00331379FD
MASKGNKSIATAASNLANLLPTGTVLAFEALIPSFSNNGDCFLSNKYLTLSVIISCSLACFFSSFTDSFVGKDDKIYYGIATTKGLYVFNDCDCGDGNGEEELDENKKDNFKICLIDFVHAFGSLIVFLVFALSSSDVQHCFFSNDGSPNEKQLIMNLPLGAGLLSTFLFVVFPTRRRGIGYGDMTPQRYDNPTRFPKP